jgi:hypothetical protein
MASNSCRVSYKAPAEPEPIKGSPVQPQIRQPETANDSGKGPAFTSTNSTTGLATNLDLASLEQRINAVGGLFHEPVYFYVATSLSPGNGDFVQEGSAPNIDGGLITLCTCKHSMRALHSPEKWPNNFWVAVLTGYSIPFKHQQSLYCLMRVKEAYQSQAELVQALHRTGRSAVVDAKNSMLHELGDLMIPRNSNLSGEERFSPSAYHEPMIGHAHRGKESDTGWHNDIAYRDRWNRIPSMLVGDADLSFTWTRPVVRRTNPSETRPWRKPTLGEFIQKLEAVPQ